MHRRTIRGLMLAALLAISGESARADEQVIITERFYPAPGREAELAVSQRSNRALTFALTLSLIATTAEPFMTATHIFQQKL